MGTLLQQYCASLLPGSSQTLAPAQASEQQLFFRRGCFELEISKLKLAALSCKEKSLLRDPTPRPGNESRSRITKIWKNRHAQNATTEVKGVRARLGTDRGPHVRLDSSEPCPRLVEGMQLSGRVARSQRARSSRRGRQQPCLRLFTRTVCAFCEEPILAREDRRGCTPSEYKQAWAEDHKPSKGLRYCEELAVELVPKICPY